MPEQAESRNPALDVVRAAAIVMVLVIHTASAGLTLPPGAPDWWGALIWGALARPAVPLFFLCSGALMLGREISPRRLLRHNLPRIVAAMLVWAMLYKVYGLWTGGALTAAGLWEAVKQVLTLQHPFHFYYLHILLLVYAFLPAVRVFVRNASRREEEYLLALWFVTGILIPLIRVIWPFTLVGPLSSWYLMRMSYAAIGYALLGHYLRQYGGSIPRRRYALALAAGLALTFGGTAAASLRAGTLNSRFLEGMSPGPMLMALGLFGLILSRPDWPEPVTRLTGRLARAAFCIYLVHILFQQALGGLGLNSGAHCLLSVPAMSLLLLALGWITWEILRHIPVVRRYLI